MHKLILGSFVSRLSGVGQCDFCLQYINGIILGQRTDRPYTENVTHKNLFGQTVLDEKKEKKTVEMAGICIGCAKQIASFEEWKQPEKL